MEVRNSAAIFSRKVAATRLVRKARLAQRRFTGDARGVLRRQSSNGRALCRRNLEYCPAPNWIRLVAIAAFFALVEQPL